MESNESIDLVASKEVNAYGLVVGTEEHKTPCEYSDKAANENFNANCQCC